MFAFVLESDAAGSLAAVTRLVQTLPETPRTQLSFEVAVVQASPDCPMLEWVRAIQERFTPLA